MCKKSLLQRINGLHHAVLRPRKSAKVELRVCLINLHSCLKVTHMHLAVSISGPSSAELAPKPRPNRSKPLIVGILKHARSTLRHSQPRLTFSPPGPCRCAP